MYISLGATAEGFWQIYRTYLLPITKINCTYSLFQPLLYRGRHGRGLETSGNLKVSTSLMTQEFFQVNFSASVVCLAYDSLLLKLSTDAPPHPTSEEKNMHAGQFEEYATKQLAINRLFLWRFIFSHKNSPQYIKFILEFCFCFRMQRTTRECYSKLKNEKSPDNLYNHNLSWAHSRTEVTRCQVNKFQRVTGASQESQDARCLSTAAR